jgi:tRNA G18 (ribose-2'-O)-methylase SpoU
LLLSPRQADALAGDLALVDDAVTVFVADRTVLDAVAGFPLHRGALAVADRPSLASVEEVVAGATTIVVCEGLNDHENLGAIARSALGLGAGALVLDPGCCDPLYRRCVRVSMGTILDLPWTRATPWPAALETVAAQGFRLLALTPSALAVELEFLRREPDERVALVIGAEGSGLSPEVLSMSEQVRIPLASGVDSLNVGHALAIALFSVRATPPRSH